MTVDHLVEGFICETPLVLKWVWLDQNKHICLSSGGQLRYIWLPRYRTQSTTDASLIEIVALDLPASGNP